ncbi:MAG: cob(I)yrinic acid a,c-diamide adenosyltransferase [Deltaproteobacteria bacterium]|nr:cob(I)yrinic acid a,c-diamide adenosyltransferase [Deltaproteobacteria bacterium]
MAIIINRVYTGVGDAGRTRLVGGQEVEKTDVRIEAYGTVDELNAVTGVLREHLLGLSRAEIRPEAHEGADASDPTGRKTLNALMRIQNELFDLGGELATRPEDIHPQQVLISPDDVSRLETEMDTENARLPTLRSFILPGGGMTSALFHQARTVGRRAERRVIALHAIEPQRDEVLRYLNRLSDWFFVLGRAAALREGQPEVLWVPGGAPRCGEEVRKRAQRAEAQQEGE